MNQYASLKMFEDTCGLYVVNRREVPKLPRSHNYSLGLQNEVDFSF